MITPPLCATRTHGPFCKGNHALGRSHVVFERGLGFLHHRDGINLPDKNVVRRPFHPDPSAHAPCTRTTILHRAILLYRTTLRLDFRCGRRSQHQAQGATSNLLNTLQNTSGNMEVLLSVRIYKPASRGVTPRRQVRNGIRTGASRPNFLWLKHSFNRSLVVSSSIATPAVDHYSRSSQLHHYNSSENFLDPPSKRYLARFPLRNLIFQRHAFQKRGVFGESTVQRLSAPPDQSSLAVQVIPKLPAPSG